MSQNNFTAEQQRRLKAYMVKLVEARKEKNLTMEAMAKRLNTYSANISNIENGKQNVTLNMLSRLADALDKKLVIDFRDRKELSDEEQ